jgi:hypothetical protein
LPDLIGLWGTTTYQCSVLAKVLQQVCLARFQIDAFPFPHGSNLVVVNLGSKDPDDAAEVSDL